MNNIIVAKGLYKTYKSGNVEMEALRGVDLVIPQGSFACITGPSGHGKTTLLHLIGGLDRPTQGEIAIDGHQMSKMKDREIAALRGNKIGFVFQFFNLIQSLTSRENIEAAMMFTGASIKLHRDRARDLLAQVGLSDRGNSKPSELSGGQQQRVAIARALANNPEILLMDEPTGNLDSGNEKEILRLIQSLHSIGKTIVIVTHNPYIAKQADLVISLKDGKRAPPKVPRRIQ